MEKKTIQIVNKAKAVLLSLQIAVYLVAKVKLTQMKNRLKEVKAL
jgi:hypothetical protein